MTAPSTMPVGRGARGRVHPRPPIKQHGTHAGFNAHAWRNEPPCQPCDVAERIYRRDQKREARAVVRFRKLITDPAIDFALVLADGRIAPIPATSVLRALLAGRRVIHRRRPAWAPVALPDRFDQTLAVAG